MEKAGKRLTLFRISILIAGFACILHLTHRECAKGVSWTPVKTQTVEKTGEASNPKGVNSAGILTSGDVFHATAYCVSGTTKSGFPTAPGLVSADPKIIPLGSIIHIESPLMGGVYQVLDTGALIKGKIIDIFIPSYDRCIEFGRRMVKVKILRYGFADKKTGQAEKPQNPAR